MDNIWPHDKESEEILIGAAIHGNEGAMIICSQLGADDFFRIQHIHILDAVFALTRKGIDVDVFSVKTQLSDQGQLDEVGGLGYLLNVHEKFVSIHSLDRHIRNVKNTSKLRQMLKVFSEYEKLILTPGAEAENIRSEVSQRILKIGEIDDSGLVPMSKVGSQVVAQLEAIAAGANPDGIKTGFSLLDSLTGGFKKKQMVVIAGRPSMGKSAFALNIVRNAAMQGVKCAVFSIEDSAQAFYGRMLASMTNINSQNFTRKGGVSTRMLKDEIEPKVELISHLPLWVDESPAQKIIDIELKSRMLKQISGLDVVVVDYIQLASSGLKTDSHQLEIATISSGLKQIAKKLDVSVIAVSQLSRSVESRQDKRPMLSDLRDSGQIEQDADVVAFLYRPAYYGDLDDDRVVELIVAKNRNGGVGTIENIKFEKQFLLFKEYEREPVF